MNKIFIEEPRLEWHHDTPFAIARLNVKYAHLLSRLALQYEAEILSLEPDKKWQDEKQVNTTSSRYASYNIFLIDSAYLNLFLSVRTLFRFLLWETGHQAF